MTAPYACPRCGSTARIGPGVTYKDLTPPASTCPSAWHDGSPRRPRPVVDDLPMRTAHRATPRERLNRRLGDAGLDRIELEGGRAPYRHELVNLLDAYADDIADRVAARLNAREATP